MGYSEVYCQICGVSFNIGRIRKVGEPLTAAWAAEDNAELSYVEDDISLYEPCTAPGCMRVKREVPPRELEIEGWSDRDSDTDFVQADDAFDPYEYETPRESEAEDEEEDNELGGALENRSESDMMSDTLYADLSRQADPAAVRPPTQDEELLPTSDDEDPTAGPNDAFEHVAGPECLVTRGYNGNKISAEEMYGCRTLQCLVPKPPGWIAQEDDEEIELRGEYFLSGIGDFMPSRDMDYPPTVPERHGISRPPADNCCFDPTMADEVSMPFHPYCLEVYKRASLMRLEKVDIKGLTDWYRLEADYDTFEAFPRDQATDRAREQWWQHNPGDEFLAANPCFPPTLQEIILSPQIMLAPGTDQQGSPFGPSIPLTGPDDFSRFPLEIRLDILSYLSARDIANLRLASRCFYHIPRSFFRFLVLRDMPWLWEAWSSLPYSHWATTTASEFKAWDKAQKERRSVLYNAIHVLKEESTNPQGESNQDAITAVEMEVERLKKEAPKSHRNRDHPMLHRSRVDWHLLYHSITTNKEKLQGLKNRERIWKDCEEILNRIERYRAKGEIGDNIVVDARERAEAHTERARRKIRAWTNYCRIVPAHQRIGSDYRWEDWADRNE